MPGNRLQDDGGVTEGGTVVDGKSIIEACEGELRRLQTDFLDLFQIHWTDRCVGTFWMRFLSLGQSIGYWIAPLTRDEGQHLEL